MSLHPIDDVATRDGRVLSAANGVVELSVVSVQTRDTVGPQPPETLAMSVDVIVPARSWLTPLSPRSPAMLRSAAATAWPDV